MMPAKQTLRLGIGFQGVSNGTRFVTINGDEMDGPDTDFEVDVLLSAGVGFDIRLGDHWSTGLSLISRLSAATSRFMAWKALLRLARQSHLMPRSLE